MAEHLRWLLSIDEALNASCATCVVIGDRLGVDMDRVRHNVAGHGPED